MSTYLIIAATATAALVIGRLSAWPQLRRLRTSLDDLEDLLRIAQHINDHDRLTGLYNRTATAEYFTLVAETRHQPTLLALIDLDWFKQINDAYGYAVGDDLIRTAAGCLATTARQHGGFAARLGGDEFLLVLPANGGDPRIPVEQALTRLAEPAVLHTDHGDTTVTPSASAGIAVYDGTTAVAFGDLLHHADIALHHAKQSRAAHCLYQPHLQMPRNAGRHGPRLRDQHHPDGQARR